MQDLGMAEQMASGRVSMKYAPLLLALVSLLCASCANITPPPRGESIRRNIVYAQRPTGPLRLDIYLPEGKGPHPTVLWIHGGGWKYGFKSWMLFLRKLTRGGYAVVSIQYRLSGKALFPAQIEDCREALRFLQQHGPEYGLQTRHVFVGGASAGGHLAALLALQEGRSQIDAACLMYPATNLIGFDNQDGTKGYLPELLGGSVQQKRALAESGSPVRYVSSKAPPFLSFHGEEDTLVPIGQSEELDEKLRAAGVESHLIRLPKTGHNFALTDAQLGEVAAFFRRHRHR